MFSVQNNNFPMVFLSFWSHPPSRMPCGQACPAEPFPLRILLQIAHFRPRRLSGQISASGRASPEEHFPLHISYGSPIYEASTLK